MAYNKQVVFEIVILLCILIFAIWLHLGGIYGKAGVVLGFFSIASWLLVLTFKNNNMPYMGINGVKRNTFRNIIIAMVGIIIVFVGSLTTGWVFLKWDLGSVVAFSDANRGAVVGSSVMPFENDPSTQVAVYGLGFPAAETITIIFILSLLVYLFKARLDLKDTRVYIIAIILGFMAVFYHFFAKQLASGVPDYNALNVIFWIFFVEVLMTIYTKEAEPAIYHHFINNAIALGMALYLSAFVAAWWILALCAIVIFIAYRTNRGKNLMRWVGL